VRSGIKQHTGAVVAMQDSVATIDFKRGSAPFFPVAQEIGLSFTSAGMARPFDARSRVLLREEHDEHLRYKLRFNERDAQTVRMLLKPRTSPRAVPAAPLTIELRDAEQSDHTMLTAILRDVSAHGLAFFVDATTEMQLCSATRLRIRLDLPGEAAQLDLIANVRYHRLVDDVVQIGAAFNWNAIRQPDRVRECITAYVQRRKREIAEYATAFQSAPAKR
jgi:hypothetical protein